MLRLGMWHKQLLVRTAAAELEADGVLLWVTVNQGDGSWEYAQSQPILKGQRHLAHARAKARQARLLARSARAGAARLRSCAGPGAAAWLATAPSSPNVSSIAPPAEAAQSDPVRSHTVATAHFTRCTSCNRATCI